MNSSDKIDKIFSEINNSLDSVLYSEKTKHEKIIHTLKAELKLSVNLMVQKKPENWKIIKETYIEVLKMISDIESEV